MVAEIMVLLGIQHFEHRGRWVTTEIIGHFIDFIEQEHRVDCSCLLHALDHPARHSTDISSSVAANF